MRKILLTLFMTGWAMTSLVAQTPLGFNYQAVIRNSAGEIVADKQVGIQLSILSESTTGTSVYVEAFTPTTNEFGLINLTVGQGNAKGGSFTNIDWSAASFFLKVELDISGGTSYTEMGITQLLSVPFANFAFSGGSGSTAWTDQEQSVTTQKNVGIGTVTPSSMLQVASAGNYEDEAPLFEVKNAKGETVFAVYENRVEVIVNDDPNAKTRGGFAVSGRTTSKEEPSEILLVTPEITQIFVDTTAAKTRGGFAVSGRTSSKEPLDILHITPDFTRVYVDGTTAKTRGGFAVSGRTTSKEDLGEILLITPEMTQIFVDESTSKTRGGFAVSGRTTSKETFEEVLSITPSLTQFYVAEESKTRGGFAVSGRTTSKEPLDIFHVTPDFTRVYVDEAKTKTRGGFAVSGRTTSKETGNEIFMVTPGLTEVFVEETTSTKTRGGFAVSGRTTSKSSGIFDVFKVVPERTDIFIKPNVSKALPEGFSISGLNDQFEPTELFTVSEQGTYVSTALAVAPKLTTLAVSSITQISAITGGNVLDNGGSDIMMRGIVYSSTGVPNIESIMTDPSIAGLVVDDAFVTSPGLGEFSGLLMESLKPGVKYTVRAFATNTEGLTGYGPAQIFTTLAPTKLTFAVKNNMEQTVTNAVITVWPLNAATPIENAPGYYIFNLPNGEHSYSITAEGYHPIETQYLTIANDTMVNIVLTLEPVKITFVVVNQHSELVPWVGIDILEQAWGQTDETGTTSLLLPPGTWTYSVTLPEEGFENHPDGEITVLPGVPQTVNITVTENPKVTFNVTDTNGDPVSEVEIKVVIDAMNELYGMVFEGKGTIYDVPAGTHGYTINDYYNGNYATYEGSISVEAGKNLIENVVITLLPKHIVTFIVTDESSNPIVGADVNLNKQYEQPWKGATKEQNFNGQTNSSGYIIFDNVTEGDYSYSVSSGEMLKGGYVTVDQNKDISVTLAPPKYFSVTFVVDTLGIPVEGANVSIQSMFKGNTKGYYSGMTDSTGTIIFNEVQDGDYLYTSFFNGLEAQGTITVDADIQIPITLTPPPSFTVSFLIIDKSSNPVEGANVSLYLAVKNSDGTKSNYNQSLATGADGKAVFEDVPMSYQYEYYVYHDSYLSEGKQLDVDGNKEITIVLEPAVKGKAQKNK